MCLVRVKIISVLMLAALAFAPGHVSGMPLNDGALAQFEGANGNNNNNNNNSNNDQPYTVEFPNFTQENADGKLQTENTEEAGFKISLLPTPSKTAESVNLEHESIPSRVFSAYDNSQQKVANLRDPQPILDTIEEHEKYGNNGDMFDGLARSIVNGYETFSNILNRLIQTPKELTRSISKGITAQLDVIGGKIVGL